MAEDVKVKSDKQCILDRNGCVTLKDILIAFNAPINEEHAWALCYQCSKCFKNAMRNERERCLLVSELNHVLLHRDGQVHPNTIFAGGGTQDQIGRNNEVVKTWLQAHVAGFQIPETAEDLPSSFL